MQTWSRLLRKLIPSLIFATVCMAFAAVCFALDPSPSPSPATLSPGTGIGGWVQGEGGFVAAIVAVMLSVMAILKAFHDVCVELHLQEPGWLGKMAGVVATVLRYLTGSTQAPDPADIPKK